MPSPSTMSKVHPPVLSGTTPNEDASLDRRREHGTSDSLLYGEARAALGWGADGGRSVIISPLLNPAPSTTGDELSRTDQPLSIHATLFNALPQLQPNTSAQPHRPLPHVAGCHPTRLRPNTIPRTAGHRISARTNSLEDDGEDHSILAGLFGFDSALH